MKLRYRLLIAFGLLLVGVNFNPFFPAEAAGAGCPTGQKKCGDTCYSQVKYCCCDGKLFAHTKKADCQQTCKAAEKKPAKP